MALEIGVRRRLGEVHDPLAVGTAVELAGEQQPVGVLAADSEPRRHFCGRITAVLTRR